MSTSTTPSAKPGMSLTKKLLLGLLAFAVVGALLRNKPAGTAATSAPALTEEAAPATASVTKAAFDKIQTGMSYQQVVALLGKEGQEISRNNIGGSETVMYQWEAAGFGANMNAMFQNNKLISKAQMGLN